MPPEGACIMNIAFKLDSVAEIHPIRTDWFFLSRNATKEIKYFVTAAFHLVGDLDCWDSKEFLLWVCHCQTLSNVWTICHRADWMLMVVEQSLRLGIIELGNRELFRQFACSCVKAACAECGINASSVVLSAAESHSRGAITKDELFRVQKRMGGGATGAGVCGLPKWDPVAALQLGSWHTADSSPLLAALRASHFAARAAEFKAAQEGAAGSDLEERVRGTWKEYYVPKLFGEEHPEVPKRAGYHARLHSAEILRKTVPNPFLSVNSSRLGLLACSLEQFLASEATHT